MIVQILSYTPASRTATIQQPDGTILAVQVSIDFANFVGYQAPYEEGILTLSPQPPVTIVATDPATVIEGGLIYNTTVPALKVGRSGSWVVI